MARFSHRYFSRKSKHRWGHSQCLWVCQLLGVASQVIFGKVDYDGRNPKQPLWAVFLPSQQFRVFDWFVLLGTIWLYLYFPLNLSSVSSQAYRLPGDRRTTVSRHIMPHVFNYETKEFEQVHYNKVPQRTSREVKKRQRVSESMKCLLAQERTQTLREEAHAKLEASMKDWEDGAVRRTAWFPRQRRDQCGWQRNSKKKHPGWSWFPTKINSLNLLCQFHFEVRHVCYFGCYSSSWKLTISHDTGNSETENSTGTPKGL